MFPKFNKLKLPSMQGFEPQFDQTPVRPYRGKTTYPGGAAAYTGEFEKPHTHKPRGKMMPMKPRVHKRF